MLRPILPLILALVLIQPGIAPAQTPPPAPEATPTPEPATPTAPPVLPPPVVKIPDRGDFRVVYEKPKNPDYRELQGIFKETQLLEETVKALNETVALPADVSVTLRECGTADAPWEADRHRISICYELVDGLSDVFAAGATTPEDLEQAGIAVAGATLFLFSHQAGHALIQLDALAVPEGTKDEAAADQLATLLLLASGRQGEIAAANGAATFLARERDSAARARLARLPFWTHHGFDEARLRDVLCWVYGRNAEAFQDLVEDGSLAEERAAQCPAESERTAHAWAGPLAPYLKGDAPLAPPAPAVPAPAPAAPAPAVPAPTPSPSPPPPTP